MATVYSSWSQYNKTYTDRRYRAFLTYNVSQTETTYKVTAYSGAQINKSIAATWTGTQDMTGYSQKSGSKHLNYTQGATDETITIIATQTYTFTRTTSAQTKTLSSSTKSTESGFRGDTVTATAPTITVPALRIITVTYNANGGSGAPAAQSKYYGYTMTLTSAKPTRTGYTFLRWNTNSSGSGTNYASGSTYSANSNITLYAVWQLNTYQVVYYSNGGSGSVSSQTKLYGTNLTLYSTGFTKSLYNLSGWNTSSDGTGTAYALGATYSTNAALTLYAQWTLAYVLPTISNVKIYRTATASSTTETDDGEYIYVGFNYVGGNAGSGYIPPTCIVTIDGTQKYSATLSSGSGSFTTGSSPTNFGVYSKDLIHNVHIKLYDSNYSTGVTFTESIPTATYGLDLLGVGTDIFVGINHIAVSGQAVTTSELFIDGMIGTIQLYAGPIDTTSTPPLLPPNGWLCCDGSAISRTEYSALYNVIGIYYGDGDGNTTFNLPNFKGRVPIGAGTGSASTSTNHTLGSMGGQETHTLTASETALKTHTHSVTLGSHRHYPYSGSSYKFVQTTSGQTVNAGGISGSGTRVYVAAGVSATTNWQSQTGATDLGSKTTDGLTEANGSAHNNMQPYLTINYIIFAGVATI